MTVDEIFKALEAHFDKAAIVRELTIDDEAELSRVDGDRGPWRRRCDALMFNGMERTVFEIKISAEDAKRESWRKIRPWERVVHRYVYVVPAGLISVPPVSGCGLIWVHDDGKIEWKRKCSVNRFPEPLPQKVIVNIAFRAATGAPRHF